MKQVWFVAQEHDENYVIPTLFDTKEAAERYARILFPELSEDKRYVRIYFRNVLTMADLNGG